MRVCERLVTRYLRGILGALIAAFSPALALELRTGDGLAMTLDGIGQVTGLSADRSELLSPGKAGGFLLGEYRLNPGPELVENGGFEAPGGFRMDGGWHRDTTAAHSGKASLALKVPEKGELLIHVPLKPDAVYLITFYMKSEDLDGTPILHLRRLDAQGNYLLRQANIEYLGIYHPDWVRCQHTFQTLPGTVRGEMEFHVVYGNLRGKVWIDDLSIRELPQPEPVPLQGSICPGADGATFQVEWNGIRLQATLQGLADRIAIEGVLRDTTGADRCVQLTYRLPVAAVGWRWYTGLDSFQRIEPGHTYTNAAEIGRDTNRYISPWPYSSIDGSEVGLSLGMPMDRPSVCRMGYDGEGYYTVRLDFGLSPHTEKFPGQAKFALFLSRHDPQWGMRAAAEQYFAMFPQFFAVRTRPGATAQTALIAQIKGLEDFGVMYGDRHGGDVRWIKSANEAGMYAMTYNEPWMWRSRLGPLPQPALPPAEEILAREQGDVEVWDENDAADYGEVSRAYSVRAFLNSVFHDEAGQPVMNGTRTYGTGRVVEWLTNADPEISGPFGQPNRGMLSWTYEYGSDAVGARKLGGTANGIRYDSLEEWAHLGAENFRQEHFAFADLPLTFSYRAGRPCQLGYFCALEYMTFVRGKMLRQDGITYANGAIGVPWFTWLLDGISREGWNPEMEDYQRIRMLMYQKTCGDWGGARWRLPDAELERRLNTCLTYAWWPGIDGAPQQTFDQKRHRGGHLYTRFPDVDTCFVRLYVKFTPKYCAYPCGVHLGGYNPPAAWPQGDVGRPRGDDRMMVEIIPTGEYGKHAPPGVWAIAAFWPDMKMSADGHYWGNNLTPAQPTPVASDRWQCVEVMVKSNSAPDQSDGELALWLDGQLRMHIKPGVRRGPWSGMGFTLVEQGGEPFEGFRWRTSNELKVNFLWLLYNATTPNPASPVARVWYDDIAVSTQYVGPIQK